MLTIKNVAKQVVSPRWKEPPEGLYKINCDGAFLPEICKGGWGFIIRNNAGLVAAAGAGASEFFMNAQHAETMACFKGIEHAARMGLDKIIVETDAASIVDAIRNSDCNRSSYVMTIREIRVRLNYDFSFSCISHCPWACNSVAHILAAIGLNCEFGHLVWYESVPEHVSALLSRELPSE